MAHKSVLLKVCYCRVIIKIYKHHNIRYNMKDNKINTEKEDELRSR